MKALKEFRYHKIITLKQFIFKKVHFTPIYILVYSVSVFIIFIFIIYPVYLGLKDNFIGIPGDGEQFIWQSKNLLNIIKNHTTLVSDSFFGISIPYSYTPLAIIQSIVYLIFFFFLHNLYVSYNLTIGFFLTLNFYSMYFVLRKWERSIVTSLIFSFIFAFTPSILLHAGYHISLFIVFTIPLFIYSLFLLKKHPNYKTYGLAAILFSITFYTHEYYAVGVTILSLIFFIVFFKKLV